MTIELRPATRSDLDAVLALWRDADAEPTHTDDVDSLTVLLDHDQNALILACDDARVVGSVIAAWDGWRGSIYRLVVAPDVRRRRLGVRLVKAAEARLSAVGATRLQAIVVEHDDQATAFWRSTGWERQLERLRFVCG